MKLLKNPVQGAIQLKYPLGNIYQLFGENVALYMRAIGSMGHNGLDYVKGFRTPILASEGKIINIKNDPSGYGRNVRILTDPDENGDCFLLAYGHLDEINPNLKIGDRVKDNQEIGKMGNTGFVISGNTPYWGNAPAGKGVHLHFGTRACTTKRTPWILSQYNIYVKDNDNGLHGYVDPMKYLEQDPGAIKIAMGIIGTMISVLKKIQQIVS